MPHAFATIVLASILIPIAVIDQRRQIIPNILNVCLFAAGLIYSATHGFDQLLWAGLSVAATGLFFAALRWAYGKIRKRQGLGWGDVKFLAAAGAWIAPLYMPWLLLAASMSALLYIIVLSLWRSSNLALSDRIAFGPHLAFGLFAAWFLKPYIAL
jgi:leader peptidase (prepilin peptidase)/N-methyltransferase